MEPLTATFAELPQLDLWSAGGVWWGLLLLRGIRDAHERVVVALVGVVATYQGLSAGI